MTWTEFSCIAFVVRCSRHLLLFYYSCNNFFLVSSGYRFSTCRWRYGAPDPTCIPDSIWVHSQGRGFHHIQPRTAQLPTQNRSVYFSFGPFKKKKINFAVCRKTAGIDFCLFFFWSAELNYYTALCPVQKPLRFHN